MFIALAIGTALLALMCVASASGKLRKDEQSVAIISGRLGVPVGGLAVLAALERAGGAGILVGLWLAPLGVAAAAGLVTYFVGAMIAHARVGDFKGLAMPLLPLLLSVAVLALRIATM